MVLRIGTLVIVGTLVMTGCTTTTTSSYPDSPVREHLALLSSAASRDARYPLALQLSEKVRQVGPENVSEDTVDRLIELLDDRDDIVRFAAAATISLVGPRARRAEPALRRALQKPVLGPLVGGGNTRGQSFTSEGALTQALIDIGADPPK